MDRTLARRLLVVSLAIGIAVDVLLDGPAFGINVPIAIVIVVTSAWLVRRRDRAPDPLDAWLPVSALVLAGFAAVRADPVVALDVTAALVFAGASVAAFSGLAVTRRSAAIITMIGVWVIEGVVIGCGRAVAAARPARDEQAPRVPSWAAPLGRGLFLGVPLALMFAVLFASADPIFRRGFLDVLGLQIDLGDLPGRVLFIGAATWFAAGLLGIAAVGIPAMERSSLGAASRTVSPPLERMLGATEALVVLVAIVVVFGLFVLLQLAYLFGGQDTLAAAGMTYSAYARRGYFELVAAAGLAGGLLVVLELLVMQRTKAYVALAVALIGLTGVVLASAAMRLQLYQDAYGWTELRLYVAVSIVAMAASLVALAAFIVTARTHLIGHALAVIGVVSLIGLNVLAPSAFVAARNVDRVIHPELVPPDGDRTLDLSYLNVLADDAVPVLVRALPSLPASDAADMRVILDRRRAELASDPTLTSPAAWNVGREAAKAALSTLP